MDRTHLPWDLPSPEGAPKGPKGPHRGPTRGPQGAHKEPLALPQRLGRVPHRLLGLQGLIPNGVVPMRPQGPMGIPQSQGTKGVAGHQAQPPTWGDGWAPGPASHPKDSPPQCHCTRGDENSDTGKEYLPLGCGVATGEIKERGGAPIKPSRHNRLRETAPNLFHDVDVFVFLAYLLSKLCHLHMLPGIR